MEILGGVAALLLCLGFIVIVFDGSESPTYRILGGVVTFLLLLSVTHGMDEFKIGSRGYYKTRKVHPRVVEAWEQGSGRKAPDHEVYQTTHIPEDERKKKKLLGSLLILLPYILGGGLFAVVKFADRPAEPKGNTGEADRREPPKRYCPKCGSERQVGWTRCRALGCRDKTQFLECPTLRSNPPEVSGPRFCPKCGRRRGPGTTACWTKGCNDETPINKCPPTVPRN